MHDEKSILIRKVDRRNIYRIETLPWIARVYKYPFERWSSHGRQALFGVFNVLLFHAYQRFLPGRAKGVFTVDVKGTLKSVRFNTANTQFEAVYRSMYRGGYEPEVSALLDVIMPSNGVFYDVGSNWGYFSVFVAARRGFTGKVHAFEPFPPTFRDLESVVAQAGLGGQIRLHNQALSDYQGNAQMIVPDFLHSGWATLHETEGRTKGMAHTVTVNTLDAANLDAPSVIKIDAERTEAKVLIGGEKLIRTHRPHIVFESVRVFNEPAVTLDPFLILKKADYMFFVPAWVRYAGNSTYLLGCDHHPEALSEDVLALVPLPIEERFLRGDLLNVLACPRERVGEIKAAFHQQLDLNS